MFPLAMFFTCTLKKILISQVSMTTINKIKCQVLVEKRTKSLKMFQTYKTYVYNVSLTTSGLVITVWQYSISNEFTGQICVVQLQALTDTGSPVACLYRY